MDGGEWISRYVAELEKLRAEIISLYTDHLYGRDQKEGLTHVQAVLLKYLLDKESSTVSATADFLGVTMAAVSSLVDRLVRTGLLNRERSESDRRVVYISLTPGGREAIENHLIRQRKKLEQLVVKMGKENTEHFVKAQEMLRDALLQVIKEKNGRLNDNAEK